MTLLWTSAALIPEFDPIERVWKLTLSRCLHNGCFSNRDKVIAAVEAEFGHFTVDNDTLRRVRGIT